MQLAVAAELRVLERLHGLGESDLGHHERGADALHFLGGLAGAVGEKSDASDLHFELSAARNSSASPSGKLDGTAIFLMRWCRRINRMTARSGKFLLAVALHLLRALRPRDDLAMPGLATGAINFQIVHHDVTLAAQVQVDEWIGHEHADGVEHVGIAITVCHDEQVVGHLIWLNLDSEEPVPGIAQTGDNKSARVQLLIDGRRENRQCRIPRAHGADAFGRRPPG